MSKNIEFEKRVMLTESQYKSLKGYASNFKHNELLLVNHYFDDEDLSLIKHHHVLRIREINDSDAELTLKVKGDNGDLEINESIAHNKVKELLHSFRLDNKEINKEINKVTNKVLKLITSLKTERIEIEFDDYLFVLDKNYYSNVVDYDLEIESSDIDKALEIIKKYCHQFGMQYREDYLSKSRRAINKALNR